MKRKSRAEQDAYRCQAEMCKAFANSTRLHLIALLSRKQHWASELRSELGISKSNLSQHLSILKSAGIVSTSRIGKQLCCGLSMPGATQIAALLRSMTNAHNRQPASPRSAANRRPVGSD